MAKYQRIKGGEVNEKTGVDWTRPELEKVCDLYIKLGGKNIHEGNQEIHDLASQLNRTVRSVENQLLGFKKVATNDTGRKNYNRLIPLIWKKKTSKAKNKLSSTNEFQFRISSALKDIIGQDLITDDYIAVFELVKNAFDAYATRVDIYFENIYTSDAKIIIKDNGKGMDANDLKNKWLFVAYSAKKEGTEDENFDYRDNIYKKRAFAGAKGIGRFSCDRLGRMLYLETTKKAGNSKTEILVTDWGRFEENSSEEFVNIGIEHFQKNKNSFGLKHGTVLVITELRSLWDRAKFGKLKSSLAKLINPNRGKGEHRFSIYLHVEEEEAADNQTSIENEKINGEVVNFVFEKLGLKTTKISSSISRDGKLIVTELKDSGVLIYKITEPNEFDLLDSIDYTLYYLNQSAKVTFKSTMGVASKDYGHIFLYKNGFRIYPFGEPGEDPLKIDARKNQGARRFLGTRELIGQIEIYSDTDQLKETSSRGDGLIKTDTYSQLQKCFEEVLRRLEKYVVDVQRWGLSIEDDQNNVVKTGITKLISRLTQSKKIIAFEYPENLIEVLNASNDKSADRVVKNLHRLALASKNDNLLRAADETARRLLELRQMADEIEEERDALEEEKRMVETQLQIRDKEVQLLKEASNDDVVELMSIEHHINQATYRVNEYLGDLHQTLTDDQKYKREIQESIDNISLENKKIASLVKFVRKANFDLLSADVTQDLIQYIEEYIEQVYKKDKIRIINKTIVRSVNVRTRSKSPFIVQFVPLEINIVLDNLLDNSFKAFATNVDIFMEILVDTLIIDYKDTGVGINPSIRDRVFEFGATTTAGGSGIGMHHVRKIIKSMGGNIYIKDSTHGANFIIEINRK